MRLHSIAEQGCHHTIITSSYRFADQVKDVTQDQDTEIIYDGLGQQAFNENLEILALRGHWVSFGQASGAQNRMAPELSSSKFVMHLRPVVFHYTAQRKELNAIADKTCGCVLLH